MKILCHNQGILIRRMEDSEKDYQYILKWFTNPEILQFYEGRDQVFTLERIIQKYSPRILGLDYVIPCIIEYDGEPIGYIQFYPLEEEARLEYGYSKELLIYGIDVFIGNTDYQNKGLGVLAITTLMEYIIQTIKAEVIVIDPIHSNKRAIRCYEKCGFRLKKVIENHQLHEGIYHDTYLMEWSKI
jgi:aminoglycoside 6'-N-acetyltransferase